MTPSVQRATQAEAQRDRSSALELEKEALRQQIADLNDRLSKAQRAYEDLKKTMDNMVPRCACLCVCLIIMCVSSVMVKL
jgi:flagellar capping protein FliD